MNLFEKETEQEFIQEKGEHGAKRIGFFGAYSYDIVLYLARVLCLAGKQVMIIDRSTEQEVIRTIRSVSEGDLQLGIFRFCGIDVTARVILPESMHPEECYDVILFDFGGNMCPQDYHSCDVICYVLDMYVHNALRIQEAEQVSGTAVWMVLRDLFRGKALARYHMRLTGKTVAREDTFAIRLNSEDFVARFRMETDQLPRIELASEEMRELVYQMAERICPDIARGKAYRKAKRKGTGERFTA